MWIVGCIITITKGVILASIVMERRLWRLFKKVRG
jgi:hypothetical protein